jgi:hypothetical protein
MEGESQGNNCLKAGGGKGGVKGITNHGERPDLSGARCHGGGEVEGHHALRPGSERSCESPSPASEVQDLTLSGQHAQHEIDLALVYSLPARAAEAQLVV